MALVALKWHPELVKAPLRLDASQSNSLTAGGKSDTSDHPVDGETEWTESVQFLPHTDSPNAKSNVEPLSSDKSNSKTQQLKNIVNGGPIFYQNKGPNYSPYSPVSRGKVYFFPSIRNTFLKAFLFGYHR